MLPVEEVLRMEQESELRRKNAAIARKKRAARIKYTFLTVVALILFSFSPPGLEMVIDFSKPRSEGTFFRIVLSRASDIIWVYGSYEVAFASYKHLFDQYEKIAGSDKIASINFYNMAITQYMMQQYRSALIFYQIYKKRWPDDLELIAQVDRRLGIISVMSQNSLGLTPAEWILDLADRYEVRY